MIFSLLRITTVLPISFLKQNIIVLLETPTLGLLLFWRVHMGLFVVCSSELIAKQHELLGITSKANSGGQTWGIDLFLLATKTGDVTIDNIIVRQCVDYPTGNETLIILTLP